jgi:nitrogen regulatory protein PII
MLMVVFVLHDSDKLEALLEAWEAAGVYGVTILHSTGIGRTRDHPGMWDDLPLMPGLRDFYEHEEYFNRTLFTIVPDEATADKILEATSAVVGDLHKPEMGLLAVIPLLKVYGLEKHK